MRFATKLTVFAVVLTAGLSVYRLTQGFRDRDPDFDHDVDVVVASAVPEVPEVPERPEVAELPEPAEAPTDIRVQRLVGPGEVRILTTNHAAFLSLRDHHLVAGLSDSIRQHIDEEMKRELRDEAKGVGRVIGDAVLSGVTKLLDKEIAVPVSEIRDIDYRGKRIVIRYRDGRPRRIITFESIKSDGDKPLLEQFSEDDARRLVEAVRAAIR